jgi:hypothetical protein
VSAMKISGHCSACGKEIVAVVRLPATMQAMSDAVYAAHGRMTDACIDAWFGCDEMDAVMTIGAEDRPSSVFNICRHGATCGCYIRCACGWTYHNNTPCKNPNHAAEISRKVPT